jgi:hypothetical protein
MNESADEDNILGSTDAAQFCCQQQQQQQQSQTDATPCHLQTKLHRSQCVHNSTS